MRFFFVFLEIGRKARALNVVLRPGSSWMSRETYVVAVFYPAILADYLWPSAVLHGVVAVAAAAFLYCQVRILHAGRGIPAWRVPLMPGMLTLTGLLEGAGLLMLARALFPGPVTGGTVLALVGLALAAINFWMWRRYRATAKSEGIGPLARRELARVTPWLHGIGHAVPVIGFAVALIVPWGSPAALLAVGIAGAGAVAGGVLWKFTVITRACYQQGFAMPKMPQRGSGTRAAPVRLEAPATAAG